MSVVSHCLRLSLTLVWHAPPCNGWLLLCVICASSRHRPVLSHADREAGRQHPLEDLPRPAPVLPRQRLRRDHPQPAVCRHLRALRHRPLHGAVQPRPARLELGGDGDTRRRLLHPHDLARRRPAHLQAKVRATCWYKLTPTCQGQGRVLIQTHTYMPPRSGPRVDTNSPHTHTRHS